MTTGAPWERRAPPLRPHSAAGRRLPALSVAVLTLPNPATASSGPRASAVCAPDLYRAAACSAPLLDMVRYEKFGLGQTWNTEYGSADDPQQLGWLLSYSPYHHVREGVPYPATLFLVFESDTRVDPLHARKMCAAMQHATSSGLPGFPSVSGISPSG